MESEIQRSDIVCFVHPSPLDESYVNADETYVNADATYASWPALRLPRGRMAHVSRAGKSYVSEGLAPPDTYFCVVSLY